MRTRPTISVCTVAEDGRFLDDCFASLQGQAHLTWEWVVLLVGEARWRPPVADGRVRLALAPEIDSTPAGKRAVCSLALADLVVELPPGDTLRPGALDRVSDAFATDPDTALAYSDVAVDASPESADAMADGSLSASLTLDGRSARVLEASPPTPHHITDGRSSPRGTRAFRRAAYELVGGYDLSAADVELDLTCRIYQVGSLVRLPEPVYWGDAGRLAAGASDVDDLVYATHLDANALAWSRRQGLLVVDLSAAGQQHVDDSDTSVSEQVRRLGLEESSVGLVRAVDVLQRVPDVVELFNEIYRVLAPGGLLLSATPSTDGRGAFQDPRATAFHNENTFRYFTDDDFRRLVPSISARFSIGRLRTLYPSEWHESHDMPYVEANLIVAKDDDDRGGGDPAVQ